MNVTRREHINLKNICLIKMIVIMSDIEQASIFMKLFLDQMLSELFFYICVNKWMLFQHDSFYATFFKIIYYLAI